MCHMQLTKILQGGKNKKLPDGCLHCAMYVTAPRDGLPTRSELIASLLLCLLYNTCTNAILAFPFAYKTRHA